MLTFGSGPEVSLRRLEDIHANGYTPPPIDKFGNQVKEYQNEDQKMILMDPEIAAMMEFKLTGTSPLEYIEAGTGKRPTKELRQRTFTKFINTLFHEGTHYGRFETGKGNSLSDLRRDGLVDENDKELHNGNEFEKAINSDGKDTPDISEQDLNQN